MNYIEPFSNFPDDKCYACLRKLTRLLLVVEGPEVQQQNFLASGKSLTELKETATSASLLSLICLPRHSLNVDLFCIL